MEGQSGLSELSVISWVSAFEGCPLSGVPLYLRYTYLIVILNGSLANNVFYCFSMLLSMPSAEKSSDGGRKLSYNVMLYSNACEAIYRTLLF